MMLSEWKYGLLKYSFQFTENFCTSYKIGLHILCSPLYVHNFLQSVNIIYESCTNLSFLKSFSNVFGINVQFDVTVQIDRVTTHWRLMMFLCGKNKTVSWFSATCIANHELKNLNTSVFFFLLYLFNRAFLFLFFFHFLRKFFIGG